MKDAYLEFFDECVNKETFFEFGLSHIIKIPLKEAIKEWKFLKSSIISKNNRYDRPIYIRSYGRNKSNNALYIEFYKNVFDKLVLIDPSNNTHPRKLLQNMIPYTRRKTKKNGIDLILNYQVSHVFGMTKNAFCFCAPWNVVYVPKMIDALTGHEAKGDYVLEFQYRFRKMIIDCYRDMIMDYNSLFNELNILKKK